MGSCLYISLSFSHNITSLQNVKTFAALANELQITQHFLFLSVALQQHRPLQLLRMNMHLLADPGTSLLLQHSLDRLVDRLCPSLHIFHVSERVSLRTWPFPQPMTGRSYIITCSFCT